MRRRSAAKNRELRARRKLRADLEQTRGRRCQAQWKLPHVCGGPLDLHEVVRRSQGGDPLDPGNVLLLCRVAHDWVGRNPAGAVRLGLARWGMRKDAG